VKSRDLAAGVGVTPAPAAYRAHRHRHQLILKAEKSCPSIWNSASLIDDIFRNAPRVRTPDAGESGTLAQGPLSVRLAEVAGRSPFIKVNVRLRRAVGHRARLSSSW
jgi:hypothetical protein